MSKFVVLFFSACILYCHSFGQSNYRLKGSVVDENHKPLPGATVFVFPANKGTVTDVNGNFVIGNLSKDSYKIEISFVGYRTLIDTISDISKTYRFQLSVSALSLQEVVVTDNYAQQRKREESLNVEIVNDDYLKQNQGGSLMSSLERLPGVTTISIGSGQSKPVIRGLGFNRVVVIENNIKHEAQQWGADHGLEIDQFAVDNIEVIKGPASLMYGSEAIGGVIDVKNKKLPLPNSIGGNVTLTGKTNNDLLGTSVLLYGRKKWFYASVRGTYLDYGDYKVPTDSVEIYSYKAALYKNYLRNTAGNEKDLHVTFGVLKNNFQSKFNFSSVNSKSGFFANAHGLEPRNVDTDLHDKSSRDIQYPYQQVNHNKLIHSTHLKIGKTDVSLDLGVQHNFRQEWSEYVSHGYMPANFPDTLDFSAELEREFDKYVYSANLKHSHFINKIQIYYGINGELQENTIDGRGFIIPEYKQNSYGVYLFTKYKISPISIISAGGRFDYGKINTSEYYDWFSSPVISEAGDTTYQYLQRSVNLNRNFNSFSWSVGYNFNPSKWELKINVGKSFRMPIAKELSANGVNYHRFSYEVGDANLSPEISYQLDAGVEYTTSYFTMGVTPFVNYFTNYIYLNPSSDYDRLYGNGNQVYYYTESEVFRYGSEIHAHYDLSSSLQLGVLAEYVYSEQMTGEKKGYTLPFSPPPSAILNFKYRINRLRFADNTYLSLDYRLTAAQNNIVPPEEPTDGYQLVNIQLGSQVKLQHQKLKVAFQVQNLFNTKYFNHTSYYRLINVPESGRNFIVNISIPFSGSLNNSNY